MEEILTSQTLWEGYDPSSEELDVTVLNTTEKDGIVTKRLYFTGRELGEGKTRVYGVVCQKSTHSVRHAILVIHDFEKEIDEKVLVDLAERGFVAMAIDYVGAREMGLYTLYPKQLSYCNASAHQNPFDIVTTAKEVKLYEYALNSRRAITYILSEENVKAVSVFGVAKGVDVATMVLGTDDRVINGALALGRIWRNYPPLVVKEGEDYLGKQIEYDFKSQSWMLGLAPQTYMLQIKVPLYIIISANSTYTNVRNANKSFTRVNCVSKLLILPKSPDYIPKSYTAGIVKWFKGHYESDHAEIVACNNGSDYRLKVVTQLSMDKITLWYTINAAGRGKNWVKANLKQGDEGSYYAEISLYEPNCKILAFAHIDGELPTTTKLFEDTVTVSNLKKANNIIFSAASGQVLPPVSTTGEWWNVDLEPKIAKGPMNIVGAIGRAHACFAINDTSSRYNSTFTLGFDVYSAVKQNITVTAICKFGEENVCYHLSAGVFGGRWERITYEKEKFHRDLDGKPLTDKDKVDAFVISADSEFIINNILLV
ncbi:MAG: hypothetical protein J1F66_03295 [Clostridiales bacterium]|nr:hypothetical protein [Clostridiales bacterium]